MFIIENGCLIIGGNDVLSKAESFTDDLDCIHRNELLFRIDISNKMP